MKVQQYPNDLEALWPIELCTMQGRLEGTAEGGSN